MLKMLIVDDEPIVCEGIRSTIPWEEYSVKIIDVAHDGEQALKKIKTYNDIDIVLLDVMMPVMDGLELAEHLYSLNASPKIIMISGHEEFEYAKKALRLGVKDYLLKPVDIEELLTTVQKLATDITAKNAKEQEYQELLIVNSMKQQITNLEYRNSPDAVGHMHIYPILSSVRDYYGLISSMSPEEIEVLEKDWQDKVDHLLTELGMKCLSFFVEKNILLTAIYSWNDNVNSEHLHRALVEIEENNEYYFVFGIKTEIRQLASQYATMRRALIQKDKKGESWQIARAIQYIKEYYNRDIKAYEVADYINISPNYFSSLFKQHVGMNFNEYLNKIRVENAKVLLKETPYRVSLIAKEVGYQEYKYFAQIFKKLTHLTPTEYRKIQ